MTRLVSWWAEHEALLSGLIELRSLLFFLTSPTAHSSPNLRHFLNAPQFELLLIYCAISFFSSLIFMEREQLRIEK
jgi:hypothetical protein